MGTIGLQIVLERKQSMIHSGELLGERDGLRVIDCAACGFAHLETLPNGASLIEFYRSDFWQKYKAGALDRLLAQYDWWLETYGGWLELVERHVKGRRLFDVGCGYGFLMEAAREMNWNADGIEPNDSAAIYAKQYGAVTRGTWQEYKYGMYDCVAALWLMEHLPDPLQFLEWCRLRLDDDGVLLVVVPNDFTGIQDEANRLVRKPFYWIDKTHLCYFSWSSFSNLLGRAGFRIIERQTLYPMENFLFRGDDYTVDDELGARRHDEISQAELRMPRVERLGYYHSLALDGRGREIVVMAVKE